MNDESLMPFGPYKGDKLINVPAQYLLKLLSDDICFGALQAYLEDNEEVLIKQADGSLY